MSEGYSAATVCLPGGRNKLMYTMQLPIFSATTVSAANCKYLPDYQVTSSYPELSDLPASQLTIQQH